MAGDRYLGMVFVYERNYEMEEAIIKMIEIMAKKYEAISGYWVDGVGGEYIEKNKIMGWRFFGATDEEDLPYYLKEDEYEIVWEKEMPLKWHRRDLAYRIENIVLTAFPPRGYLDKHGVDYNKKFPYPMGTKEGPEVDIITPWRWNSNHCKRYVALDFGTYENYFYSEDEKLNRAVEEFLVDLMRDIARETEPEYGYMDMNEYRPLERDPVCETGRLKIDYYMDYKGNVVINSYLPPLLYLSNEIINKNGGRAFEEYMENQKIKKKIWGIDRLKGGVFYHIGDVVLPAERPQRSYVDIADYLLGDRIEKIKKEIKEGERKDEVLCDY